MEITIIIVTFLVWGSYVFNGTWIAKKYPAICDTATINYGHS